jgi:septum formation topological specificity factor MinE
VNDSPFTEDQIVAGLNALMDRWPIDTPPEYFEVLREDYMRVIRAHLEEE